MTDYDVLYRGVPVPKSVLVTSGWLGGEKVLEAFKLGVDATHQMFEKLSNPNAPESGDDQYDYFTDDDTHGNEWIWRYRKGEAEGGELTREYAPGWKEAHTPRETVSEAYNRLWYWQLPAWARD